MMKNFGGTNITLERIENILDTWSMDGTKMKIKNYFKEIDLFRMLIPGISKVWVPYGGAECYGILDEIQWKKVNFNAYSFCTEETKDWWFYEPILKVSVHGTEGGPYYVYEYSFYEENLIPESEKIII